MKPRIVHVVVFAALTSACSKAPTSQGNDAASTASTAATAASSAAAPKSQARVDSLANGMSLARKKAAIADQVKPTDPVKVGRVEVKKKDGKDGVEMDLQNTSGKPVVAFSGYVYGFDAVDEPEEIALGGEFTTFLSPDDAHIEPGQQLTTWRKSHYKLKSKTALAEIVKVKFADGTSWRRGE
jgi:hypothetical protein